MANDSDVDGDDLTVIEATVPAEQGTLVDNGDGTVTFTPADDFLGEATISYTISDPSGEEASAVHVITVNDTDNAPEAVDDVAETDEDTPVTIDAVANDTDPNGDPLTITEASVPEEQGTVDIVDNQLVFTPAEDFTGEAEISYTVEDPDGNADEGTVTVTVNPVNDAPDAVDDVATTEEDTPVVLDLIDNDSDPEDDLLTVTEVSVPEEQGTVVNNGDGTATFTPAPDFVGEATVTYTIADPDGEEDTAVHVVDVTPINDAPDAVDDADVTDEDTPVTVDLLANDTDVDGDDLRVVEATVPEEEGTLVDNGDGTVTFTPAPDFNGDATITYTISDGNGGEDTAEHVITVGEENDAPVTEPDTLETDEDTPSEPLNVLANDTDPDGDPLELIEATSPDGTVAFTPEGEVIFTPDPDFNGETTITYTVTDPSGEETEGTVTVTVNPVNDAPDAVDDVDVTPEDTPITVDLLANDTDVDGDDLTVVEATVPEEQGTLVDNGDGTVTFTPAEDFTGEATISYTIEDEEGLTDSAEHLVYVNEVSDVPVANDDIATTEEDTPVTIDALENDTDPDGDDTLIILEATVPEEQGTVEIVDNELVFTPAPDFNGEAIIDYVAQDPDGNEAPAQVTVTVDPVNDAPVAEDDSDITDLNTPVTVDLLANDSDVDGDDLTVIEATVPEEQGTLVENGDGTVTFTPSTDFTGEATISYTIEDEEGLTDDAVHVITVNDTENAPTAVDDTAETDEDTPVTIDVLENDTDPTDDPLTITEASVPEEQGTVEIVDNQLVFTPAPDFNGPAEISYTVEDPDGNADEGTVAVTVNPVNDAPVAEDDEDVTDINTPVTVDLLANDSDVDGDDLTVIEATVPAEEGTLVDNGDGTVTFTPATDFVGEATISYTIEDEEGLTDDAVHVITVEDPENTPPVAVDDVEETPEDTPVIVDLIGNDTDEDGDPLTLVEATVPEEQGTLEDNGDGTVTFTPAPDFNGPATITYTVADPDGEEDEGEAIVTVTPVNDAPVAEDDRDITDFETPVTVDLLANDSDVDGDDLTVIEATVPAEQGTLVDNGDGTVTFTPADDFTGDATISYTIEDEEGLTDEAVHVITVNDTDNAPTAVDDAAETDEETPVTIDVLDNDTDPTDDPLTVVEATVPEEQGTVEIVDNQIVFTPAEDFTGEATIDYIIEDPDGNADEAVVTVTVNPVNDAPDAVDDVATTEEDTPVVLDLIDNDSDPEGDPLTVTEVSVPEEQGTVVNNGDGTATFTPAPDFVGEATVTYTIADPDGEEDTAVHVVDVTPVNDAPDAVDDADTTDYNTPVTVDLLANDTDIDGDELTVIEATVPEEQGTLVDNGDGTVTFTPVPGFIGDATITYTIEDEGGLRDSAEHVITVEEPGDRDGIVEGTDGSDLIDPEYAGDPDGDFVDNEDAILPGQEPNDDIIIAGDGDDTVLAGLGDDSVTGGEGNDSILGEDGSDTVDGGDGDDVIDTSGPDLAPDDGYPFEPGTDDLGYEPDTDPENDRDSVIGGAGNDTITTGDDSDTISGGDGDDVINAGIDDDLVAGDDGDDRIVGGEGDDTITGGFGNDTIYGGTDPDVIPDLVNIVDEPSDDDPFSPDRNPDNGRDLIDGGAGDDLIFGDDDDDTITGGSGNDTIDGGIDDDTIDGGTGDDSLIGGQGNDTLRGNRNDDTLIGGTGDDVLDGGGENDLLEGGDGDDDMMGGQGDDTLRGGDGDDTMTGGAGQDVFEDVGPGDVIDGGSGPVDMDTLDLTGSKPEGGSFDIVFTSDDEEDGVVNYFDADGEDAGQLVFEEIETIIPCFTPGTKIATPKGERLVEELKVGDRVITRDNGIQEIRWVGARDMTGAEFEKAAHLKPVLIRQGALGNDLPERDMMVSPNHRVLVANDKTALYFEEREVLVAAKHLTGLEGVDIVDVSHTTYIHVMFDQHEVILSDGSWTESFQPGDMSLAGIGNAQRQEILELFPELATQEGVEAYASARRSLKKHEAKLITK
ncbi:putative hemagglutinin/hemolysin-related protein [Sulfitobacter noctilucicola]|nr:putative hemagglutinin/hemolysin-related protein [Sulfitobacter noctilucicola]